MREDVLSGVVDTMRLQREAAAQAERDAIVAWLRDMKTGAISPELTAERIEAGEHLGTQG